MSQGRNREFRERNPVGGSKNGITCYGVALGRAAKGHRLEDPGEEGSHLLSDIQRAASLTMVLGAMLEPVLNNTHLAVKYCSGRFGAVRVCVNQTTAAIFEGSICKTVCHEEPMCLAVDV
jgi:hypothetical protein